MNQAADHVDPTARLTLIHKCVRKLNARSLVNQPTREVDYPRSSLAFDYDAFSFLFFLETAVPSTNEARPAMAAVDGSGTSAMTIGPAPGAAASDHTVPPLNAVPVAGLPNH